MEVSKGTTAFRVNYTELYEKNTQRRKVTSSNRQSPKFTVTTSWQG